MPVQALRGRLAATAGMPSDILNMLRTPTPMEMYGETDYGPQTQVPYGSQELLKTLPLAPQGPAQQAAANLGALAPMTPAEALQAARLARQAALAGGKSAKAVGRMAGEELNAAMFGERPGTILGALTPQPKFVFVGENSKIWNKGNATKAVEMEKAGAKPEDIWMATGTFRGPEGKLRQEISDVPATLLNKQRNFEGKLHETLGHPELFENYPGLQYYHTDITSEIALPEHLKKTLIGRGSGSFTEKSFPYGEPKITAQAYSPEDKGTLLHEIQHAVQAKEGFARGGSPSNFVDYTGALERARKNNGIDPVTGDADFVIQEQINRYGVDPFEAYSRLAGEAEARAVQKRMNMTDTQRRVIFPYESYDVPINQLIVRKP
jgi:hypothetical protein